jgi:hypothetical protein
MYDLGNRIIECIILKSFNLPFIIGGVAVKDEATVLREKLSRRDF